MLTGRSQKLEKEARLPPLPRTAAALAVLFLADLGITGQGFLSLLVAGVGGGLLTSGALWAAVGGRGASLVRNRATRAVMYLLLGVATVATTQFHRATAQNHAAQVIESHTLMYVAVPPFGRRLYHFEDASWSFID